jgi:hypothetical protein
VEIDERRECMKRTSIVSFVVMLMIVCGIQLPLSEAGDDEEVKPPILVPDAGPDQNVSEGDVVVFDGSASRVINGTIDEYNWDFDATIDSDLDGNFTNDREATGAVVSHRFGDDGDYGVTLTIGTEVIGINESMIAQDTILIIDSSGSMGWNDPLMKRQKAATDYLYLMSDNDSAAVVVFGEYDLGGCSRAGWLVHNMHLTETDMSGKLLVKGAIDYTRFDDGGTNIEKALQVAHQELLPGYIPSPTELMDCSPPFPYPGGHGKANHAWVEILLTDGEPTHSKVATDDEVRIAAYAGITIFTIGLGTDIDEDYLRDIAYLTGGMYFYAPTADDLQEIYNNISEVVKTITGGTVYASDSLTVHVENVSPSLTLTASQPMEEGNTVDFWANVTDPGSDDIHLLYEWGDGSLNETSVYLANPPNPDPYPSPEVNPRDISEKRGHTFGDNWNYSVKVAVWDDDGGAMTSSLDASVGNLPPSLSYSIPTALVEGETATLSAHSTDDGSDDLRFTWWFGDGSFESVVYYNNESGPDPSPSPWGIFPFYAEDTRTHAWGDDGAYSVTISVRDDDGSQVSASVTVTVSNLPPEIVLPATTSFKEGVPFELNVGATDPGSDDIELTCTFELGPTRSAIHYNNGSGPDPKLSPWGTFPFSVSDKVEYTYGDNGWYNVTVTVKDDDSGTNITSFQIEIRNQVPVVRLGGPYPGTENSAIMFQGVAGDSGSDDLTFVWNWGDGSTDSVTYYNNGISEDLSKSPSGIYPFGAIHSISHTWGDNGAFLVRLMVMDDDGAIAMARTTANVDNINPVILNFSWTVFYSVPRTQGYWNFQCIGKMPSPDHVGIQQQFIDYISIRSRVFSGISTKAEVCDYVGNVDNTNMTQKALQQLMALWLNIASGKLRLASKLYVPQLNVTMTLAEVIIWIEDIIHNNRDMMETAKDLGDEINSGNLIPYALVTVIVTAFDPGSDDLIFMWDWGDGDSTQHPHYNDGIGPDPYPSPEINPINVTDVAEHSYTSPGDFVITLTLMDDDNGNTTLVIPLSPRMPSIQGHCSTSVARVSPSLVVIGGDSRNVGIGSFEGSADSGNRPVLRRAEPPYQITTIP